ncbi:uncharacterized protein DUF397 [Herbihabitans rhizosphaerae]|uniref:Uncharacterized protein DUF397 n=1 Tax=Herbihabitans rhizosphaerae TaxID=1872711 RepID=A0A4Q7KGV0_9PSEU|nr:DUF397 domain-containing protein [Herbihabitans rhizosphaerae]RZS34482.1 uncharacterized protein DUF397 [Herbihabitans rhizosphaerae]
MDTPDLGALSWRKSTRSGNQTNCVELAWPTGATALRDSKNPGPAMVVQRPNFGAFLAAVKDAR